MSVTIKYFVHGTTIDNEKEISSGASDVGLSELGVQQSNELREALKDQHFDVVFCSDLIRAVDSAELVFGGREIEIIKDVRIRECDYGEYNRKSSVIVEPLQEKNIETSFPNGESYEEVKSRIEGFVDFLRENYDGKMVAIVAHKAPQLALDVILEGKNWGQAFADDWRKTKSWQPGWTYVVL